MRMCFIVVTVVTAVFAPTMVGCNRSLQPAVVVAENKIIRRQTDRHTHTQCHMWLLRLSGRCP